jgi:sugar phosphate isomerase/epimerase
LAPEHFVPAVVDAGYTAVELVPPEYRSLVTDHDHIGHYHTADNPGRHEMDKEQELYYPAILRAIKEAGHTGYITHEFVPRAIQLLR